jgi:tetratricopeptide (TPR) repeat protein
MEVERFLPHVGSFLVYLEESFRQNQQTNGRGEISTSREQLKLSIENESIAVLCNNYARYYEQNGQYTVAEKYYECVKNICEVNKDIDQNLLATSYNNLALFYASQGRYEEAEPLYSKAIDIYEKLLGENRPDTARSYNNLAELYRKQSRYEEAEPLYIKAQGFLIKN